MRDTYRLDDGGCNGFNVSGPYEETEARRRFPNDMLFKLVQGTIEPFYTYLDDPES